METNGILFRSVKDLSDGKQGALCLTKSFTVEFLTDASRPESAIITIPLQSLGGPNKVQVKKDTSQVRLVSDKGSYIFDFPTKSESMRFLTSLTEALKKPNHSEKRKEKDDNKEGDEEEYLRKSSDGQKGKKHEIEGKVLSKNLTSSLEEDYKPSPRLDSTLASPKSDPKMGSSPPVNNFGQPISQKPFVHARVIGNRKVVTETAPHDPFVIFTIQTESNLEEYASNKKNGKGDYLWTTNHRFSEFEALRDELMRNHLDAAVPSLPPKSFAHKFNPSFLNERAKDLNQFLSTISSNPRLMSCVELRSFLTKDPHANVIDESRSGDALGSSPGKGGGWESYFVDTRFASALETVVSSVWSNSSNSTNMTFETQMEMDYYEIQQLAKKYNVASNKLPFQKFVVLALGTTSAGKSSFINHFFGIGVKKEADAQQDVCFTIVEVVPSSVFEKYAGSHKAPNSDRVVYPPFSASELAKNVDDVYTDKRYNHVFTYLDTPSTLTRYQTQLAAMNSLATRTILIDSPGFNSETLNGSEIIDRFIGNLRILQALYSLADETLYFIPATHLNMVSNQLQILELSLLYSIVGADDMESLIHSASKSDHYHDKYKKGGSFLGSVMKNLRSVLSGKEEQFVYKGTSIWEKTLFVLSKVDLLQNQEDALRHVFYELGGLFAKSFTYLPNPVADSILTLSLPSRAHTAVPSQLYSLTEKLKAKANQSPYEKRVELAIQSLCSQIEKVISASWTKVLSNDGNTVKAINARSVQRLQSYNK